MFPDGERIPCSVRKERSDVVSTAGKNDSRTNVARAAMSVESGSPRAGSAINRCASEKLETPATASTASFQSANERAVANGSGIGCLYSQMVETRYGSFSSKIFSASSVRPPHVELYRALIG